MAKVVDEHASAERIAGRKQKRIGLSIPEPSQHEVDVLTIAGVITAGQAVRGTAAAPVVDHQAAQTSPGIGIHQPADVMRPGGATEPVDDDNDGSAGRSGFGEVDIDEIAVIQFQALSGERGPGSVTEDEGP